MQIPSDIIIQLTNSGNWVVYNVFTRDGLGVTGKTLELLKNINQGKSKDEIISNFSDTNFTIWNIGVFSNSDGLFADPSQIIREKENWPDSLSLNINDVLEILEKNHIVITDEKKYNESFQSKTSLLDNEHIGNFHQQLGQHILIDKRQNPAEWWVNQKFSPDRKNLKENLYKYIQEDFLKSLFNERFTSNHSILDIGCGVGLYSKMMGETGASVIGIDPNEKYIEIANEGKKDNVQFRVSEIGNEGNLDWVASDSADFVFISDALLFYFISPDPTQKPILDVLFSTIRRILKPGGRFFCVEPHGNFFLKPWMGEIKRPFTIMAEYNNKNFRIVPNISEILQAFINGKFILRDFKELYVNEKFQNEKREINFAKEFPLWWFFELEAIK